MIELIRAIVRPALALTAGPGTLVLVLLGIDIPEGWWGFLGTATTFYFIQRHDEKRNGNTP